MVAFAVSIANFPITYFNLLCCDMSEINSQMDLTCRTCRTDFYHPDFRAAELQSNWLASSLLRFRSNDL